MNKIKDCYKKWTAGSKNLKECIFKAIGATLTTLLNLKK